MRSVILFVLAMCFAGAVSAQNAMYKNGISFKFLKMDYQSQNGGSLGNIKDYSSGFEFAYSRSLSNNFNLVLPLKFGVVNQSPFEFDTENSNKTIYGADAQIQYQFFSPERKVVPLLLAGLGFVGENEGDLNMQAPIGAGVQIRLAKNAYASLQSEYRLSFSEDRNNLHHSIGFVYLLAPSEAKEEVSNDDDKDGIPNELDLCPEVFGSKEMNGCPDTDEDGVADYQDKCPEIAGLVELMGCPDADGDGIADKDDECPNEAGTAALNGCPDKDRDGDGVPDAEDRCPDQAGDKANGGCPSADADNDGIPDISDQCPNQAGSISANGCPDRDGDGIRDADDKCPTQYGPAVYNGCPDTDGDGIDDSRDRCPTSYGPVSTNGCPEIAKEDREQLDIAMRAVQFDTGRSTLKSESYSILNQIQKILMKYPDYSLSIDGHTDNTGSPSANQKLSERRAKACYEYLMKKGISSSRLSFTGYGESRPIADNSSLRGRSLNRRVEFNLVPTRR